MTLQIRSFSVLAGLSALVLAGCATESSADRNADQRAEADAVLAGYTLTGETRSCVNVTSLDDIKPLDDLRWLVTMRGGDTYLNEVSRGCSGAADPFTYLQYSLPTGQLCRGEIVRVLSDAGGMFRGSCGLGDYQTLEPRSDS